MADPHVISKGSDVRQTTRVLTVRERESLEQSREAFSQIANAGERYQNGADGPAPVLPPGLRINRKKLTEQQAQIEKTLKYASPEPIADKDRDAFKKRADALKEKFKPFLETRAELTVMRREKPEWRSAMKKAEARLNPKTGIEEAISEYQSIMRRLEPDNEEAGSLHDLRTDR
jgi:hypothetical protein